ncbi:outer membrane protein assembly factor BamD [Niveibacterium sp. SC-1]|uniref:tetratricopeptide repeat protein n=1 Tax=Niveibacterium sp. SC-1 TaxID=3135646 RepID=UPI00311D822A
MTASLVPFWQRLPSFFAYPLQFTPLAYMSLLAAACLLVPILPLPAPLDLLVVLFGIWLAFLRFAYGTLEQSARGRLQADGHDLFVNRDARKYLPYKQFGVLVVMALFVGAAHVLGRLPGFLAQNLCSFVLPASVIVLAMTDDIGDACNPAELLRVIQAIGWPYLGLYGLLFLLDMSRSFALMHAGQVPAWLLWPTVNFVAMYFTLTMFALLGYVMYQYHEGLGHEVDIAFADSTASAARQTRPGVPRDEAAETVALMLAEGRVDEALGYAYEEQRQYPDKAAAQERYLKLLFLSGKAERALAQGHKMITRYLSHGRDDAALETYRRCVSANADFQPELPASVLRLAQAALKANDTRLALGLVKGFDKRNPGHADIPGVYFFTAQVLCERLRDDAKARRILEVLLQRYPEHPLQADARRYLTTLDRLAAQQ